MPTAYEAEATVPTTVLEMAHRCGEVVALADVGMKLAYRYTGTVSGRGEMWFRMEVHNPCTYKYNVPVQSVSQLCRGLPALTTLRLNPCVSTHALATLTGTPVRKHRGMSRDTHDSYRFSKLRLRHTRTIITQATLPVQRPGFPAVFALLAGTLSDVELRFFVSGHVRLINLAGAECEWSTAPNIQHTQQSYNYNRLDYDIRLVSF
jgi:hypothetical protein